MHILALQDVNYRYPGTKKAVLRDVRADFEAGTLYGIMGKSGAGKSTLLSLIAGLDLATEGIVAYNGMDLRQIDRDRYRARDIGVIFQAYNLLTNATAAENIELSLYIAKAAVHNRRQTAYTLLEQVGIDRESADRKVLKLSGGEQQRVGIARALCHDPAVVIADEPTGNLDGDTEETILRIFHGIAHEQGKCVILVTHSPRVAAHCDAVHLLDKGTLRPAAGRC